MLPCNKRCKTDHIRIDKGSHFIYIVTEDLRLRCSLRRPCLLAISKDLRSLIEPKRGQRMQEVFFFLFFFLSFCFMPSYDSHWILNKEVWKHYEVNNLRFISRSDLTKGIILQYTSHGYLDLINDLIIIICLTIYSPSKVPSPWSQTYRFC